MAEARAALGAFYQPGQVGDDHSPKPRQLDDPQLRARGIYAPVPDPELGPMRVQAPVPRFSATPGLVTHLGPPLGADNADVYRQLLGFDDARLQELHEEGVI